MNIVGIRIKKNEQFGYTQTAHRRYQIKIRLRNMNKEQADKIEAAIRTAINKILPKKDDDRFTLLKDAV